MPEPRISSQPPCLQSRQPWPWQTKQSMSTSAEGSVNGKNDGRKRIRDSGPNISRANSPSVPLRSAIVTLRSTASPSTWWNIGECDASATSRRKTARQREIEPLARPLGAALRFERLGQARFEQSLEHALGLVRRCADQRPLLGGERAERPEELGQDALAAEEPDAGLLEVGGRPRGGDGLTRLLRDRVDARIAHELPALRLGGLGELREPLRVAHRHLGQHLAIEQDPGLLQRGHEPRVREPGLAARGSWPR